MKPFFLYPPTIMFLKHIYKRHKETHTTCYYCINTESQTTDERQAKILVIYSSSKLCFVPCQQTRCHYPSSFLLTVSPSGLQEPRKEVELELKHIFTLSVTYLLASTESGCTYKPFSPRGNGELMCIKVWRTETNLL